MAGAVSASSTGTTVTADGTAHTKGAYAELVAATPFAVRGFLVMLGPGGDDRDYLIDIAIGAAASERDVVANLVFAGGSSGVAGVSSSFFPLALPQGVRLSARCQSTVGGATVPVAVLLVGETVAGFDALYTCTTYGAAAGDSGGVSVDAGASANTKGNYSEIAAATGAQIRWLGIGICNAGTAARATGTWLLDIAVGAGGSERVIIPDLMLHSITTSDVMIPQFVGVPVDIPAGTRIAARVAFSALTNRTFDVVLYGVG
jgi:hypothetical protein